MAKRGIAMGRSQALGTTTGRGAHAGNAGMKRAQAERWGQQAVDVWPRKCAPPGGWHGCIVIGDSSAAELLDVGVQAQAQVCGGQRAMFYAAHDGTAKTGVHTCWAPAANSWWIMVGLRTDGCVQTSDGGRTATPSWPTDWRSPQMNTHPKSMAFAAAMAVTMLVCGCGKSPDATGAAPGVSAAASNVSDMDVTEHVKTALQQNESLKGFDISVVTLKGDVRLTGMLDSQAQIDEALKIARTADGAHTIHDELTVKK